MELEHWSSKLVKPGDRYGRLTVLSTNKIPNTYRYVAVCRCDCGNEVVVRIDTLRIKPDNPRKATQSCGCLQREAVSTHQCTHHPIFHIWSGMMRRCYANTERCFRNYGGRGITVCERWHDPNNFITDMYPSFKPGLQIDRINNDGPYSLDNCKWSTVRENNRHKRTSVMVTCNGKTQSLIEWSEQTGINYGTLWDRIKVQKLSPEEALKT